MSRPEPSDIVGSLEWIMDQIEAINAARGAERINIAEATQRMGYKRGFLNKPWRVPGFGLSGNQHTFAAWCAWIERPEVERRAEWDAMSVKQRGLARGAA
jgi:hypothetical protein